MLTSETLLDGDPEGSDLLAAALFVLGLGLSGYGGYIHFTVAAQLKSGRCDGCSPWHPLFVLAPLVIGISFVLVSGHLLYRR